MGGIAGSRWVAPRVLKYEEQPQNVWVAAKCQTYPLAHLPRREFDGQE